MTTTRSELVTKGKKEMKLDRTGRIWDDDEWNDAINEGIFEILNRGDFRWQPVRKNVLLSTVATQENYDLEVLIPDFIGVDLVKYDGIPLESKDYVELQSEQSEPGSGTPTYYSIYQGDLYLNPIPASTTTDIVELFYRADTTDLDDDNDQSPFVTKFDRAIALYACYSLLAKSGDSKNAQRAALKFQRFNQEIGKLYKTFLVSDKGQLNFTQTYVSRTYRNAARRHRFGNI